MIDMNGIMNALQTPGARNTAMIGGGGALAGLAAGMLAGKSGKKMIGKAAKYGAVAALGGLAYHAISKHQSRNQGTQPPAADYAAAPSGTAYLPSANDSQAMDARAQSLVRAMINAAKADGLVTSQERRKISERMQAAGLDAQSQAWVEAELAQPMSLDRVVTGVTCPEHAAEIYAASLVAIDAHGPVERAYLQMLAARLALDPSLVEDIHASAEAHPIGAPAPV